METAILILCCALAGVPAAPDRAGAGEPCATAACAGGEGAVELSAEGLYYAVWWMVYQGALGEGELYAFEFRPSGAEPDASKRRASRSSETAKRGSR